MSDHWIDLPVIVSTGGSSSVTVTNFPAIQPVSGTVTANQGTNPWVVSGTISAIQSGTWSTGRTWTLASSTDSITALQGTSPWIVSGTVTVNAGTGTFTVSDATTHTDLSTIDTTLGSPFQTGGSIGNTSFIATQTLGSNLHVDVDNFPSTQPVSGTVAVSSISGIVEVDLESLAAFQTSQYTVGTSAVQITSTPLTNRRAISIKAITSTSSDAVYVGNNSGVTTTTGYPLFNLGSLQLDLTPAQAIWVIGTNSGQLVYALEIGA